MLTRSWSSQKPPPWLFCGVARDVWVCHACGDARDEDAFIQIPTHIGQQGRWPWCELVAHHGAHECVDLRIICDWCVSSCHSTPRAPVSVVNTTIPWESSTTTSKSLSERASERAESSIGSSTKRVCLVASETSDMLCAAAVDVYWDCTCSHNTRAARKDGFNVAAQCNVEYACSRQRI